jgi:hypothetical protein
VRVGVERTLLHDSREFQSPLADCNEPLRFDPIWLCVAQRPWACIPVTAACYPYRLTEPRGWSDG